MGASCYYRCAMRCGDRDRRLIGSDLWRFFPVDMLPRSQVMAAGLAMPQVTMICTIWTWPGKEKKDHRSVDSREREDCDARYKRRKFNRGHHCLHARRAISAHLSSLNKSDGASAPTAPLLMSHSGLAVAAASRTPRAGGRTAGYACDLWSVSIYPRNVRSGQCPRYLG
jgi:hypothetical protein